MGVSWMNRRLADRCGEVMRIVMGTRGSSSRMAGVRFCAGDVVVDGVRVLTDGALRGV